MTDHQIVLVQTSFAKLIDQIDVTAQIFFDQLFALDPSLRPMFSSEQQVLGRKMIHTLLVIVNALDNPTTMASMIEPISKRHLTYGVKEEYYATVGAALHATIHLSLADASTPEIEAAWVAAYEWVSGIAKAAAYPKETEAAS